MRRPIDQKLLDEARPQAKVFLSRRNLIALLLKLDRVKHGTESYCAILKCDNMHKEFAQSHERILVCAVEDSDYYIDRVAGKMREEVP